MRLKRSSPSFHAIHYKYLGFLDLWSGQKPRWNWYLTPVVNFGEVWRAQLAKFPLTSMLGLLGFFRSFKVCLDAKGDWGTERNGKIPHYSFLVKLQPWFLSLRWKTCLAQNCSFGSWVCSERPALGQNTPDDDDDDDDGLISLMA